MTTVLMIKEAYVNDTENHRIGDSGWYEAFTVDRGELFRSMQKKYGRCVSKMYRERPAGQGGDYACGWVFQSRDEYADARPSWPKEQRTYLREVWVEVREEEREDDSDE